MTYDWNNQVQSSPSSRWTAPKYLPHPEWHMHCLTHKIFRTINLLCEGLVLDLRAREGRSGNEERDDFSLGDFGDG